MYFAGGSAVIRTYDVASGRLLAEKPVANRCAADGLQRPAEHHVGLFIMIAAAFSSDDSDVYVESQKMIPWPSNEFQEVTASSDENDAVTWLPHGHWSTLKNAPSPTQDYSKWGKLLKTHGVYLESDNGCLIQIHKMSCFAPDGTQYAVPGDQNSIQIYQTSTGQVIQSFSTEDRVQAVRYAYDGEKLALLGSKSLCIYQRMLAPGLRAFLLQPLAWIAILSGTMLLLRVRAKLRVNSQTLASRFLP